MKNPTLIISKEKSLKDDEEEAEAGRGFSWNQESPPLLLLFGIKTDMGLKFS